MSIIERGSVPAGWYPDDEDGRECLRWCDGDAWSNEVRPLVIDMVPDFVTASRGPVATDESDVVPVYHGDFTNRLAPAPERLAPAPDPHLATPVAQPVEPVQALTRRQLREQIGGPLTTAPTDTVPGPGGPAYGHTAAFDLP